MSRLGRRIGLLAIALLLSGAAIWPAAPPAGAQALDYPIPGGHFFTQANGAGGAGGTGFAVTNEGGIRFWDEFQRLGGVQAIGYPISTRFIWNGFTVQAFQKVVLQWRPEVEQAYFVNVVDELHIRGLDDQLRVFKSTPPVADWTSDAGLPWEQVVARHLALLDASPEIRDKYFAITDPVLYYGLPMAPIEDLGNVVVLRAQRVILQHWKVQTPWSNPGDVLIANGADVAKELGIFDPAVLAPQPGPAPLAGSPRYGIVADPADSRQLQLLREAGAGRTILAVSWREVEPNPTSPDNFAWAKYDALFDNAARAGVRPLVIITGNPTWAWTADTSGIIRPDQLGEFAEFVGALVARYRAYTTDWSFYNEPDCNGPVTPDIHASCWGNAGAAYAQMLQTVYPVVKQADSNARVVFGGIAFDNFQPERAYARQFLDDALAAGAGNAFDVFNFHYYTAFRPVWEPYGVDVIGKTAFLRATLQSYGVDKPFILTEIGTGSRGPGESEELQARYVAQAHARSLAAGIETVFWYDLFDVGPYGFGLLNEHFQPRPSYGAYQTFTRTVGERPFQRALTAADLGTDGVEGYEFGGADGRRVLVVWSVDEATRPIRVAGNGGQRTDLFGAVSALTPDGGTISVEVGPRPIYLEIS